MKKNKYQIIRFTVFDILFEKVLEYTSNTYTAEKRYFFIFFIWLPESLKKKNENQHWALIPDIIRVNAEDVQLDGSLVKIPSIKYGFRAIVWVLFLCFFFCLLAAVQFQKTIEPGMCWRHHRRPRPHYKLIKNNNWIICLNIFVFFYTAVNIEAV